MYSPHFAVSRAPCLRAAVLFGVFGALFLVAPFPARADGLLYQLPEDGTWVRYDMEWHNVTPGGAVDKYAGKLTMKSVGRVKVDGEASRWIEMDLELDGPLGLQTFVIKTLVPEKNLTRGEDGWAHRKKTWVNYGPGRVTRVFDPTRDKEGPFSLFLSGPLSDSMDMGFADVESGGGKLRCEGIRGVLKTNDGKKDREVPIECRLHDMTAFGVIACTMKFPSIRDGKLDDRESFTFTLAEIGKDAESVIPDAK